MNQSTMNIDASKKISLALGAMNLTADAGIDRLALCIDKLIAQPTSRDICVDLTGVAYLSSGVLNEFLRLRKCLRDRGGSLRLANPLPNVLGLLRLCRLEHLFYMDEAVSSISSIADTPPTSRRENRQQKQENVMARTMVAGGMVAQKRRPNAIEGTASSDQVAMVAYGIWERCGRPAGHDLAHWLMAECELRETKNGAGCQAGPDRA